MPLPGHIVGGSANPSIHVTNTTVPRAEAAVSEPPKRAASSAAKEGDTSTRMRPIDPPKGAGANLVGPSGLGTLPAGATRHAITATFEGGHDRIKITHPHAHAPKRRTGARARNHIAVSRRALASARPHIPRSHVPVQ